MFLPCLHQVSSFVLQVADSASQSLFLLLFCLRRSSGRDSRSLCLDSKLCIVLQLVLTRDSRLCIVLQKSAILVLLLVCVRRDSAALVVLLLLCLIVLVTQLTKTQQLRSFVPHSFCFRVSLIFLMCDCLRICTYAECVTV